MLIIVKGLMLFLETYHPILNRWSSVAEGNAKTNKTKTNHTNCCKAFTGQVNCDV